MIRLIHKDPSRSIASDIVVGAPDGCIYDPYQLAAIEYARTRRDTLIGDAPGVGKTIEALGVANDRRSDSILVVCPGFLKPKWQREAVKWLLTASIANTPMYVIDGKPVEFGNVTIINYELLKKHREALRQREWDLLVVDECHKLKNKKADRTREVFGGIERDANGKIKERISPIPAKRRIFMSGTPSLNGKPKELWPLIQAVDPDGLGSDWFGFAKRYCDLQELFQYNPDSGQFNKHMGWKWDGATNLEEMQEIMRQRFMIRRTKEQVLPYLKPKQRSIIPICSNKGNEKKLLEKERLAFEQWAQGRKLEDIDDVPEFGEFAAAMKAVGMSMIEPTIEIAEHELEKLDKLTILCYHQDVAERIAEHFGESCILITGDIPQKKRDELSQEFQQNPKKKLIVGTIKSCCEGLDWFVAKRMLVAERCWEPGLMTQGEDRIHRRGQLDSVEIMHLVREGSLADRQVQILIRKQEQLDKMLDKERG